MKNLKRTNTNEYKNSIKTFLIDCIDFEECENLSDNDKVDYLFNQYDETFNHDYNIKRISNECDRFADYLAGLPINIPYTYFEILKTAKQLHKTDTLTETEENKIIKNWFKHCALHYIKLKN